MSNKDMKGTAVGNEYIWNQGLADPRDGVERMVGLVNRVVSGQGDAPVRRYDDSPTQMAKNVQSSQKKK